MADLKRHCAGHSRRTGEPCGLPPINGATVCYWHGGAAKRARKNAKIREAQKALRKLENISEIGDAPPMQSIREVYEELFAVAGAARAWRTILTARISELNDFGYRGVTAEQVRADVQLFEKSLDRSAKIGEIIAKLNLEERKQALDQRTAETFHQVLNRALDRLELTDQQRETVPSVIATVLKEVAA